VQRGGSNVYFPLVASSIYIPPKDLKVSDAIKQSLENERIWHSLSDSLLDGHIDPARADTIADIAGLDKKDFYQAAEAKLHGAVRPSAAGISDEEYRFQEHEVLMQGLKDTAAELYCEPVPGKNFGWLSEYIDKVGLVRKLRETRALVGFSRNIPKGQHEDGLQKIAVSSEINWLPGIEVRGEGIFIEFKADKIASWQSPAVKNHISNLVSQYNIGRHNMKVAARDVDARFILIHTIAHALIKELTFTCGYGSAALRERLYCNLSDSEKPMNGVLIYTASGDSEGTLGGLVNEAQPRRLERLFLDAIRRTAWCSNDPVCIEAPSKGAEGMNLAACHGCVLLPETSCEEGNRLLDRTLLVGSLDGRIEGFFQKSSYL
jgi:hypothetical protein